MKKFIILFLSVFFVCLAASAQTGSISGTVLDNKDRTGIPGAQVLLTSLPDSAIRVAITDVEGYFNFSRVADGRYLLRVALLGFKPYNRQITITGQPLELGRIAMEQGVTQLREVEIIGRTPPAQQKGDTSEFNSRAFKTNPDASAEDLVQKLPGVTIVDGKVQAQGEEVRQVLLDGKTLFGDDAAAALRNLPAEIIDKIQVFDRQSDQSQFSGFNDGNTTKTINIVTKPDRRNGKFGKVYAGVGPDERYQAGGNLNILNGDRRITIIGQSNNINQQNFASEDLVGMSGSQGGRGGRGGGGGRGGPGGPGRGGAGGASDFQVGQQNGIATTHALGVNYADQWGKKVEVSGSYFVNSTDNTATQSLFRRYVLPSDSGQVYSERSRAEALNINHRFNMRLNWNIDSANSILITPRLSLQQSDGTSNLTGHTLEGSQLLNSTVNLFKTDFTGLNFSNDLLYRHRFDKRGRTFSATLTTGYTGNNGDRFLTADNRSYQNGIVTSDTLINQYSRLEATGPSAGTHLEYTEPVTEKSILSVNYSANFRRNESDQRTLDYSETDQDYTLLNEGLSNVFASDYLTQQVGSGYRYQGRELQLMGRVSYQYATLQSVQEYPQRTNIYRPFSNVLPMAMVRYNFSKDKNLRIFYRTATNPPSINQLQNVINNANPLLLTTGNPELRQDYRHMLFMRFAGANPEKLTNVFGMVGAEFVDNYIGNSTRIAQQNEVLPGGILLPRGGQITRPVNLDGFYRLRSFGNYGLPVGLLKSNLNLNASAVFTRAPGLVNGQLNYANTQSFGGGVVLSSNISENLDFTISTNPSYNRVNNTLQTRADNNYYNHSSRFRLNWIFWNGMVLQSDLNHQHFSGLTAGFNQDFLLWNASLGKKIFKNQQGEIKLMVFDILKQNNSIQRTVTETYLEDTETNVLQRYFMINFTYNIRSWSKEATTPAPGSEPTRGNRPGGRN